MTSQNINLFSNLRIFIKFLGFVCFCRHYTQQAHKKKLHCTLRKVKAKSCFLKYHRQFFLMHNSKTVKYLNLSCDPKGKLTVKERTPRWKISSSGLLKHLILRGQQNCKLLFSDELHILTNQVRPTRQVVIVLKL